MWNYLKEIFSGGYSLLVGMWITLRHTFRRPVTVQYPYESLKMPARYRGHIQLVFDAATGQPKCVACMACARACPSNCISLEGHKPEGATRRVVSKYTLDFTSCSLCGLCVESCSFDALEFSKDYNLAATKKDEYVMDLMKQAQGKQEK
ncbi:MAG: NADH-quinone oxidoreductase subunit I [Verrucomicrobia bacterium]|nr:MAG: NADH-quinone oxidoreductase subunit I [Verrucomicrobiota bacterium]